MQILFEQNFSAASDTGCVRKNNEDYTAFYIPTDLEELRSSGSLFIVADGVGGAARGEVASKYASDTVIYEYFNETTLAPAERLARAIKKANRDIYMHTQENGNFTRMATTMVAALILNNNLIVAHVGDSRLYLIREGKMKQMTQDHSVVAEMVRNGTMTEAEARTSKVKNRITRSVGGESDVRVDVSEPVPLKLGDRIMICSDGLTRYVEGQELREMASAADVEAAAKRLVETANQCGGADNTSVILLEMVEKAKSRKSKLVRRQAPPEKLGWDEMETQYPVESVKERRRIALWVKIGAAFIGLSIVFGLILLVKNVFFRQEDSAIDQTENPPIQIIQTEIEIEPDLETITDEMDLQEIAPTTKVEVTPEPETPDQALSTEVSSIEYWECIHLITVEDVAGPDSVMTSYFGEDSPKKFIDGIFYYTSQNCELLNDVINCHDKEPEPYKDAKNIPIGTWMIIYSSKEDTWEYSKDTCKEKTGNIYIIESTGGD